MSPASEAQNANAETSDADTSSTETSSTETSGPVASSGVALTPTPTLAVASSDRPEDTPGPITYYPPVLVACRVGETTAIWQVETDPELTRGDFSGAWLLGPDGVQGFAAEAEWIEGREDPAAMARLLLVHPVFLTEDSEGDITYGGLAESELHLVDVAASQEAAEAAVAAAKAEFEEANGKKSTGWGEVRPIEPVEGHSPQGLDADAEKAVTSVLALARGVRTWNRDWAAFEAVRKRRLKNEPDQPRWVPIRLQG
ncbi:hypothetical protein [Corynebacterium sp. MSK039]|uniref:hypothetical protein n=1 Tax=Corynebacterium sp. MSK039 TaxID=3050193 RepID=UPI00254E8965|nr:hypothetical protein [Corynebacterium sp. MSK039]MDK8791885.1 hypothetical protein [Corynebacterium sp. MSK039]